MITNCRQKYSGTRAVRRRTNRLVLSALAWFRSEVKSCTHSFTKLGNRFAVRYRQSYPLLRVGRESGRMRQWIGRCAGSGMTSWSLVDYTDGGPVRRELRKRALGDNAVMIRTPINDGGYDFIRCNKLIERIVLDSPTLVYNPNTGRRGSPIWAHIKESTHQTGATPLSSDKRPVRIYSILFCMGRIQ